MTYQPSLDSLITSKLSGRARFVQMLAEFRKQWQENTDGESLVTVEVPIGLILVDIVNRLEFTSQERHTVLGSQLSQQVEEFLDQPDSFKLL